jgi:hypothetical protein
MFVLDELYRHAGAFGGVIDLDGKKQIADYRKDFLIPLLLHTVQLQQFSLKNPSWPGLWTRLKTGRKIHLIRFQKVAQAAAV